MPDIQRGDLGAGAVAVAGLIAIEGVRLMRDFGPTLADTRNAHPADAGFATELRDAELLAGGAVLLAGIVVGWLTHRWEPVLLSVAVVVGTVAYYESLRGRQGPSTTDGGLDDHGRDEQPED